MLFTGVVPLYSKQAAKSLRVNCTQDDYFLLICFLQNIFPVTFTLVPAAYAQKEKGCCFSGPVTLSQVVQRTSPKTHTFPSPFELSLFSFLFYFSLLCRTFSHHHKRGWLSSLGLIVASLTLTDGLQTTLKLYFIFYNFFIFKQNYHLFS